jgi:hypothetical protein
MKGTEQMAHINKTAGAYPAVPGLPKQRATVNGRSPGMVEVNVSSATDVDHALDEAVAAVRDAAIRHRTGILITRIAPGSYIVRAHPEVPIGLTRQRLAT